MEKEVSLIIYEHFRIFCLLFHNLLIFPQVICTLTFWRLYRIFFIMSRNFWATLMSMGNIARLTQHQHHHLITTKRNHRSYFTPSLVCLYILEASNMSEVWCRMKNQYYFPIFRFILRHPVREKAKMLLNWLHLFSHWFDRAFM